MLALHPRVVDVIWEAVGPLIPAHVSRRHPLGCHRHRIPDRVCFEGILRRQAAAEQVADDPVVQVGGDALVVIEH